MKTVSKPLPLPFAVFDELGRGADDRVQDYAAAAVAAERERCAEICERQAAGNGLVDFFAPAGPRGDELRAAHAMGASACIFLIRTPDDVCGDVPPSATPAGQVAFSDERAKADEAEIDRLRIELAAMCANFEAMREEKNRMKSQLAAAVAAERERCAMLCESRALGNLELGAMAHPCVHEMLDARDSEAQCCASVIRGHHPVVREKS